ncbi:hypothetical protein BDY19DRAFT_923693 [Irpex rosettiformis]|uniref:Uncharacterized protein n=1 Tax=Irpex rosettiformis TaxID=378272 RepID=A0ACB8UGM3_9APHY|nr:hypothetical protein BDY19DRAFT_923693 [Irpex rosettiformis]
MKIKNIECQVICDGEALTEYQEKSDSQDQKTKSCYIVSDVGKRFLVRIKSDPHQSDICCRLWIDGQCTNVVGIQNDHLHDVLGVRIGESQLRPFIFSPVTTVDDDHLRETTPAAKDLGTLCLKVHRISKLYPKPYHFTRSSQDNLVNRPVDERSKKAGSHRVTLAEPETKDYGPTSSVTYVDPIDSPYFSFTWRYRSKAMLQAQGIVPQDHPVASSSKRPGSSTPSDNSSKRPRTDQSASQHRPNHLVKTEVIQSARELRAQRDALRAQRAAIEAQRDALRAQHAAIEAQEAVLEKALRRAESEGVKRETSPLVLGAGNGDVVDLTEDN